MNEESSRRAAERLAAKRAAVLRPRRKGRTVALSLATAALVIGATASLVARMIPDEAAGPATGAMFGYVPQGGEVAYPVSEFPDSTARFYQHKAEGGVLVRYFIHRAADGTVRAALDACAECWREARGHRQEADEVVCAHCDKRFALDALSEAADPCVPIALPVTVSGEQIAVAIPALLEAAKYFENPYRSL